MKTGSAANAQTHFQEVRLQTATNVRAVVYVTVPAPAE
jgi:hypothetical protein